MMSGAAKLADAPPPAGGNDSEAPFGWTIDRETGERRPKRAGGRPRKSPPLEDLKASHDASAPQDGQERPQGDRAPGKPSRGSRRLPADAEGFPQHRPGVITKGVNKLYRRAGKIVAAMDSDIGTAIIASTRNTAGENEPDDSVGAAWDEVARTNPRIRRFLLRAIAGGAWGQLVMAHAPIIMAIIMKDGIRRHIPFMSLLEAMAEPDETASPQEKAAALTPDDMNQMMGMASQMMKNMGMAMPPMAPATMGSPAQNRRAPAEADARVTDG